jgi:hypothetical protein
MTSSPASASALAEDAATIRTTSTARTAGLLALGALTAFAATGIVAAAAVLAGADPAFPPLAPYVFGPFAVLGVLVAHLGWRLVRRFVPRPGRVLRILVPVAVLLSLTPDVILLLTGFIPGTTPTAVVGLMLMHPIVATVAVGVSQRIAPVG